MAKKNKKHGGVRKNAGRKSVDDPKISITIQVRESIIQKFGGKDSLREKISNFLKSK